MKLILAGGSGYLGQLITEYYLAKGDEVSILTRSPKKSANPLYHEILWDGKTLGTWCDALEENDVLINLAGKNINTRFTDKNKEQILHSRLATTELLGKAIAASKTPPSLWLNASSVAVYEESFEENKDEDSPLTGKDFLARVSQQWEHCFFDCPSPKTKKATFRISLVLGEKKGSALHALKKIILLGGGGAAGSGQQMVSWISERDFLCGLDFIIENKLTGGFNFCVPEPLSNAQFMKKLRKKYGVPFGLPTPTFLLKIGAFFMGTAPELVLRSQKVIPKRLLERGFTFQQEQIEDL